VNQKNFKNVVVEVVKKYARNQRMYLKQLRTSSLHPSFMNPLEKEFMKLRNKLIRYRDTYSALKEVK
jgi:hypothetical protein